MNETMILNELRNVKNLVAALFAKSTTQIPTVDFIVDVFDRPDSSLGGYWEETGWVLRNNRAAVNKALNVSSGNNVSAGITLYSLGFSNEIPLLVKTLSTLPSVNTAFSVSGADNYSVSTKYNAKLSSTKFNVKIVFDVLPGSYQPAIRNVYNGVGATGLQAVGKSQNGQALASHAGISVYDGLSAQAVHAAVADSPAVSLSGVAVTNYPTPVISNMTVSEGANKTGVLAIGNLAGASLTTNVAAPVKTVTGGLDENTLQNGVFSLGFGPYVNGFDTGDNILSMSVDGPSVTISLNGSLVYTGTPGFVVSATRVGLSAGYGGITGALFTINKILADAGKPPIAAAGTKSFKAWISTISEPGNQTGHGTVVRGALIWSDKYHSLNLDGSYSYNPNA